MSQMSDEHVKRMEKMLEDIMERQRLSRFDTLMFLAYPSIIAGTTALAASWSQYEAIRDISILGTHLGYILVHVSVFFVFGVAWSFARFLLAYFTDDLRGRTFALRRFVEMTCFFLTGLIILFWLPLVTGLLGQDLPSISRDTLSFISTLLMGLAGTSLSNGAGSWCMNKAASWFKRSVSTMALAAGIVVLVPYAEEEAGFWFRRGKFVWCVFLLTYGVMNALRVCVYGLDRTVVDHIASLMILVVITIGVTLRKKLKAILLKLKSSAPQS